MKKLFTLINHNLLESQLTEVKEVLKIDKIISLSDQIWASIDPYEEKVADELDAYKKRLQDEAKKGDYLLVQGDFGATYSMVNFAFAHSIIPIYAATKRVSNEKIVNGEIIITTREFIHMKFRKYENE